jgi:hypothetical protein
MESGTEVGIEVGTETEMGIALGTDTGLRMGMGKGKVRAVDREQEHPRAPRGRAKNEDIG